MLEVCPIPAERFSAIRLEDDPEKFGIKVRSDLSAPRAVASIWKSHVGVLELFLAGPADGVLCVVEDDASISEQFWNEFDEVMARLPDDWRLVLMSQRYRERKQMEVDGKPRFISFPFGDRAALLRDLQADYFTTGTHLCIFRNKDAAASILSELNSAQEIIDIDRYFATLPGVYGMHHQGVGAGGFGSDHD